MELLNTYNAKGALQALFNKLNGLKATLLTDCERYAAWTLPSIFPNATVTEREEQQNDFQSLGARAVNHLSNKLTLALFAPSRPFFKLEAEPSFNVQLEEQGLDEAAQLSSFSKMEQAAMKKMMQRGVRISMPLAMKLLIVTGNALKYFPPDGSKAQVYSVRDYCVQRDLSGMPIDIITQDNKALGTLPEAMQTVLKLTDPSMEPDTNVILYTRVRLHDGRYHVFQALNEEPYEAATGSYTPELLPWIPMTWNLSRGKNYGTGLVEEYSGDFHALSSLSEAIVVGAAIAADIKFLVDPTGSTDYSMLNSSPSGSYVPGRADEISTVQTNKQNDWGMVLQIIDHYEKRLGLAFLLGSAVTRNAERVTAEEIRFQAQELETSLGGVYSRLAEDVQKPMAFIFLSDADFDIGKGAELSPVIITGLDALSRNSEAEALMLFIGDLAQIANLPEQVTGRLNLSPVIATIGAARGIDTGNFVKPEEQYIKEQQENANQQLEAQRIVEENKANAQVQEV